MDIKLPNIQHFLKILNGVNRELLYYLIMLKLSIIVSWNVSTKYTVTLPKIVTHDICLSPNASHVTTALKPTLHKRGMKIYNKMAFLHLQSKAKWSDWKNLNTPCIDHEWYRQNSVVKPWYDYSNVKRNFSVSLSGIYASLKQYLST